MRSFNWRSTFVFVVGWCVVLGLAALPAAAQEDDPWAPEGGQGEEGEGDTTDQPEGDSGDAADQGDTGAGENGSSDPWTATDDGGSASTGGDGGGGGGVGWGADSSLVQAAQGFDIWRAGIPEVMQLSLWVASLNDDFEFFAHQALVNFEFPLADIPLSIFGHWGFQFQQSRSDLVPGSATGLLPLFGGVKYGVLQGKDNFWLTLGTSFGFAAPQVEGYHRHPSEDDNGGRGAQLGRNQRPGLLRSFGVRAKHQVRNISLRRQP